MAGRWMAHFVQQQALVAERLAGLRLKAVALECAIDRARDGDNGAVTAALPSDAPADIARRLERTRLKIASLEDRVVAIGKDDVFLVQVAALCHDLGMFFCVAAATFPVCVLLSLSLTCLFIFFSRLFTLPPFAWFDALLDVRKNVSSSACARVCV